MRMCAVDDLRPGDVLGKSIYLPNHRLLIGAGYRITNEIKHKLLERGYTHIYIREEGTEDVVPEDVISEEVRLESRIALSKTVEHVKQAIQFQEMGYAKAVETLESGRLRHVDVPYDMKKIVKEIIKDILSADTKFMTTIMPKSKDSYFFDHSVNVAVLSVLIGRKYQFSREELFHLGLGSFLHDIGKVIIEQIQEKENDSEEYYREHPTFGYLLLSNDQKLSPLVLQTVNQHHERQDGRGFPIGLKGDNIPPVKNDETRSGRIFRFAEICHVANAYDNLMLSESDGEKLAPAEVIKKLFLDAGTDYNKHIIETLIEIIPAYPVGSFIRINNIVDPSLVGCYGVVARINENNLERPTIIITMNKYRKKIKPIIIDTSKLTTIDLKLLL